MPRGIPNEKSVSAKKEKDVSQEIYQAYVKGERISDIADEYGLDPQVVIGMVTTIEQRRKLGMEK